MAALSSGYAATTKGAFTHFVSRLTEAAESFKAGRPVVSIVGSNTSRNDTAASWNKVLKFWQRAAGKKALTYVVSWIN